MAKNKLAEENKKIEKAVTDGYKKIETGVVTGYKKTEDGVVTGFNKVADAFVDQFLTREGETVQQARERMAREQAHRQGPHTPEDS